MPRGGCRDGGLSGARAANALRTCSGDGSSSWAEMAAGASSKRKAGTRLWLAAGHENRRGCMLLLLSGDCTPSVSL